MRICAAIGGHFRSEADGGIRQTPNVTHRVLKCAESRGQHPPLEEMIYKDVKKGFGLAIKTWRGKSGISQEELAWRAGLHRSYVADIERGARNASLQTIEKLAKALRVSLSTLFQPLGGLTGHGPASKLSADNHSLVDI